MKLEKGQEIKTIERCLYLSKEITTREYGQLCRHLETLVAIAGAAERYQNHSEEFGKPCVCCSAGLTKALSRLDGGAES